MKHLAYTWCKDDEFFIGFLNDYPEYETQGVSLEELQDNLKELYADVGSGSVPYIRHVSELAIA